MARRHGFTYNKYITCIMFKLKKGTYMYYIMYVRLLNKVNINSCFEFEWIT